MTGADRSSLLRRSQRCGGKWPRWPALLGAAVGFVLVAWVVLDLAPDLFA